MAYSMILANNTKWVSSQLFGCGRAKVGPLGRGNLHHLMFITELLLVLPVGHMDPHITDKVTKPAISCVNYWDQVNSWKKLWKFWNGPLCRNKSGPFPLLNVAAYWESSNSEACAKKLSQILANNIENRGEGLVSEFMWGIVLKNKWKIKGGLEKPGIFF